MAVQRHTQEMQLQPADARVGGNLLFDESTPGGSNYEAAGGQPTGPPAPPRDELDAIGNLMECFSF